MPLHWNTIGMVKATGNSSSISEYHYTDNFFTAGISYYRIINVTQMEKPIKVLLKKSIRKKRWTISAEHNPSNGHFFIHIKEAHERSTVALTNSNGAKKI